MSKKLILLILIIGSLAAMGISKRSWADSSNQPVTTTFDLTGQTIPNPCNGEDVTFTDGTATLTEQIITLPDGSQSIHEREIVQGDGIDTDGNVYKLGGSIVVDEARSQTESEVVVLRAHSKTGLSFVAMENFKELINHDVDHQKTMCVGNQ